MPLDRTRLGVEVLSSSESRGGPNISRRSLSEGPRNEARLHCAMHSEAMSQTSFGSQSWTITLRVPCTQIAYTLAPKDLYRDYFKAKVYTTMGTWTLRGKGSVAISHGSSSFLAVDREASWFRARHASNPPGTA